MQLKSHTCSDKSDINDVINSGEEKKPKNSRLYRCIHERERDRQTDRDRQRQRERQGNAETGTETERQNGIDR